MQTAIPCMQFRGGSSKGLYLLASDLPADEESRNKILLAIMGGEDPRQIDGLGGADPLTSKVAIVSPSAMPDADIDYQFVQIVVGEGRIDTRPNCGNILAGVAPFAIEAGLIEAIDPKTRVRIRMLNSGSLCEVEICTPNGQVEYGGDTEIDAVPGSSAPIICNYLDIAGAVCGAILPTGHLVDEVDGVEVTCVDNGMPVVVLRAEDLGITGYETPSELNANEELKAKLQAIRLQIGQKMNLGNVDGAAVPKMCLIAPARKGGLISTRTFTPYKCHEAIGVLGAVSVATACILPGSVAQGLVTIPSGEFKMLSVEHPAGAFTVNLEVDESEQLPVVRKAGVLRTARLLSKGVCYYP